MICVLGAGRKGVLEEEREVSKVDQHLIRSDWTWQDVRLVGWRQGWWL